MTGNWSGNDVVAEFRDLHANAMGVDCTGQCALIAGKRNIALVDLNNPNENVKKVPRQSKWEISAVQWNPHLSHQTVFASACNQRADVCVWTESNFRKLGSLKSHTRVVSDLDWSPHDSNLLATCSVDTFTYLWDTRDFRKPSICLPAVAGVSQVKWNKVSSNLLATVHDGDVRIWDTRQGNSPLYYIAGHLSKIHGLDWDPMRDTHFATSSQDCSVRLWDYRNARQPDARLPSSSPVWRARFTPFGRGMVTVVVPQLRRGENMLFLWHLGNTREPVHTFVGHTDVVLAFQWTKPASDTGDRQLVTWSKDQSLRLWKIDTHMQKLCGHEATGDVSDANPLASIFVSPDHVTGDAGNTPEVKNSAAPTAMPPGAEQKNGENNNTYHTPPDSLLLAPQQEVKSPQQPGTLQQEFDLVNVQLQQVVLHVDEMDAASRTFTFSAQRGKHDVTLTMRFPDAYPLRSVPTFSVGAMTSLSRSAQDKLLAGLRETAQSHTKHSRSCIEPCLRRLDHDLAQIARQDEKRKTPEESDSHLAALQQQQTMDPFMPSMYGPTSLQDSSIPFPRTSGARFCGAGLLVCFTRKTIGESGSVSSFTRRLSSTSDLTPRAITALSSYRSGGLNRTPSAGRTKFHMARSPPSDANVSITNFYHFREKKRPRSKRMKEGEARQKEATSPTKKQIKTGPVIVYNIDCLLPVQKQLAENYVIDSDDVPGMCRKNAAVAAAAGRKDLVQVWSLAELAMDHRLAADPNPDRGAPWAHHPFGRKLFKSLIQHYSSIHDVQTLAMLSCTYGRKNSGQRAAPSPASPTPSSRGSAKSPSDFNNSANYNPYHTIHPSDTSLKDWNIKITMVRRSNSLSDIVEELKFGEEPRDPADVEREQHEHNTRFIEANQELLFDRFRKAYADILYRWHLLEKRAQVLKYVSVPTEAHQGVDFNNECQNCHEDTPGPQCIHCKSHVFRCSICHVVVKGLANFCLACGHGGHAMHMHEWFQSRQVCPTGCGCLCLENNPMSEDS